MVEVIWTKKAFGQFERAIKYINKEQGRFYAGIVHDKILQTTKLLEKNPNMGTIEPLLEKNIIFIFTSNQSHRKVNQQTRDDIVKAFLWYNNADEFDQVLDFLCLCLFFPVDMSWVENFWLLDNFFFFLFGNGN